MTDELTAVEQVQAMQAAGELHLCSRGKSKPITEAEAQILLDFAEFLSNQPPKEN